MSTIHDPPEGLAAMYVRRLREAARNFGGDSEILHGECDDILCEALLAAGLGAVAEEFSRLREGFWYA